MFQKMKDKALSKGLQIAINNQMKEYGEMLKFNLDSKSKTIELEIMLEGEKEPLHAKVNSYNLIEEQNKHYLIAKDIVTSRAWINSVASQFLSGQKFEIPTEYAKMLKLVV